MSIGDDTVNTTLFPFDEGGQPIPGGLTAREKVTATFNAIVNEGFNILTNTVLADSPDAPSSDPGGVNIPLSVPRYELDKRLIVPASGVAKRGDVITFGITITQHRKYYY